MNSSKRRSETGENSRALYIKGLPYNCSTEDLFQLCARYGSIRQIRQGNSSTTKGTAFVVYEDVLDAKAACDKLNGFNFQSRYLVVLYHQPEKMAKAAAAAAAAQNEGNGAAPSTGLAERQENLEKLKREHGID
ncbi:hypothetical protein LTR62_002742 [Meristemomyces frigidus]|uniref:RRM domain-containing protein n=1 Tax=Meristemomyces frigidus TaxID=1508187 RepID=A0AAN7TSL9_9PEZI|nr:hypothetical protein LTR62_002742 [Meristemomyces frigidus]